MATKWYVEQILEAGCAFINAIPVFIASSEYWGRRYKERNVPIIGDDITSQVGAKINHRVLTSLFVDRGVKLERTYQLNYGCNSVHIGPSDYVPWLTDRKWAILEMEGTTFGNVPLNLEAILEVCDSPNSAGVVIDAIHCTKIAMNRGLCGPLIALSSSLMKSPPKQYQDEVVHAMTEAFIRGE